MHSLRAETWNHHGEYGGARRETVCGSGTDHAIVSPNPFSHSVPLRALRGDCFLLANKKPLTDAGSERGT